MKNIKLVKDANRKIAGLVDTLTNFDHKCSDFTIFKEIINQFLIANGISSDSRKRAIPLNTLNEEYYMLFRNLCVPDFLKTKANKDLIKLLSEHFSPVKSLFAERLKFYSAKKKLEKSITE